MAQRVRVIRKAGIRMKQYRYGTKIRMRQTDEVAAGCIGF
jgi:hypothetical protein